MNVHRSQLRRAQEGRRLRWAMIPVLLLAVVLGARANAAAGSASDPDEVDGFDIKSIYWSDTTELCPDASVECITLGVEAYEAFTPAQAASAQLIWDLDFNNAPTTTPDVGADEACIRLKNVGGNFQAELYKDCGTEVQNTFTATQPTGQKAQFKIPRNELQTAGLSATATKYGLRVTKQAATVDRAPDAGFAQHCLGATACPGQTTPPGTTAPGTTAPATTAPSTTAPGATSTPTPTPTLGPNDTSATGTPPKSTVSPGEAIQLTHTCTTADTSAGKCFKPSASLTMTFFSTAVSLGTTTANAAGTLTANVTIPSSASAGSHSIVVEGANTKTPTAGIFRLTFPITVAVASTGGTGSSLSSTTGTGSTTTALATSTPSKLPTTGAPIIVLAVAGLALMIIGGAAIDGSLTLKRREALAMAAPIDSPTKTPQARLMWGATGDPSSYDW